MTKVREQGQGTQPIGRLLAVCPLTVLIFVQAKNHRKGVTNIKLIISYSCQIRQNSGRVYRLKFLPLISRPLL